MPYMPPASSLQHLINGASMGMIAPQQPAAAASCTAEAVATANGHAGFAVRCTAHQVPEVVARHREHAVRPNQCCSTIIQRTNVPLPAVWSVVRRFDRPQAYKHFIKRCQVVAGNGNVGSLWEVRVVLGLPAMTSVERLEILDDEQHVMSFHVVGSYHHLANYRSMRKLHAAIDGFPSTVVAESYVVDVPPGNTRDDTSVFADTIVRCNMHWLARTTEGLHAPKGRAFP